MKAAGGKKRYAQVGLGWRAGVYTRAMADQFRDTCELVAFCDINQGRMDLANRNIADCCRPVKTYPPDQFDRMVAEAHPDVVFITSPDVTHDHYICRAMELGCDVITEKPMTTDETRCRRILETVKWTRRRLRVTFNYRYSPPRSQVKELLSQGAIGEVLSVDFTWMLDTRHGADYFRRWHRRRENSGSLLVHKATHHFDLANWWLADVPDEVFARGSRRYYTPETADRMGLQGRGERCRGCPARERCKFYLDIEAAKHLRELYLENESQPGLGGAPYLRDRCVFSPEVDIWDSMSLTVRYRRGTLLNYMLNAYCPYEGYRIAFNGAKGRLEHACCEKTYVSGDGTPGGELQEGKTAITLVREFCPPESVAVRMGEGGHGGGDPLLLKDLFSADPPADPFGRKAGERDGAFSVLVGVAAYRSIDSNRPVMIAELAGDAIEAIR